MVETTTAMTPRRDSGELPFAIHPVADLVVNVTLLAEVQQEVEAEINRLRQLSVVVHVIGGQPSHGELHHLMQARFQEELHRIVDIQFLGKGCYHVDMVMKLLRMGSTRINDILLHFVQWEHGFELNVVMFPTLPKEWKPVMPYMASTIAQLLDEEYAMWLGISTYHIYG